MERRMGSVKKGKLLRVMGLKDTQVAYNPAAVGIDKKGRKIIAARVESANSDWLNRIEKLSGPYDPEIKFFYVKRDKLLPIKNSHVFKGMEDPFCTYLTFDGKTKLLMGGVRVHFSSSGGAEIITEIYLADDIFNLSEENLIAKVHGMKDLRFCQSVKGDIVMLTRPTTGKAYPGSIGFNRISYKELVDNKLLNNKINESKLLKFNFGGVRFGPNAFYSYPKGKKEFFRLICHAATADPYINGEGKKVVDDFNYGTIHYRAYQGYIDPENINSVINLKLAAEAKDFAAEDKDIKGPRYEDVVFPGGIIRGKLYVGVGDRSIGEIKID